MLFITQKENINNGEQNNNLSVKKGGSTERS